MGADAGVVTKGVENACAVPGAKTRATARTAAEPVPDGALSRLTPRRRHSCDGTGSAAGLPRHDGLRYAVAR